MSSLTAMPMRFTVLARDIKLSHSVFALPFALLAAVAAAVDAGKQLIWPAMLLIVVCMVLARTVAMTVNRWADADLARLNPRTTERAVPSGVLSPGFMLSTAIFCGFGFIAAASGFWVLDDNFYPVLLSPLVLAWLVGYSFTKRFTWLCHVFLGAALAISPLAAAIAIAPEYLARADAWLLAAMVLCWVAGFDVIYALQDIEPDRRIGIRSMPANLGAEPALWVSRALHLACLAALFAFALHCRMMGTAFFICSCIVAGLLVLEHALVWGSKTHRIHIAFFTVNGIISLLLGAAGIFDALRSTV